MCMCLYVCTFKPTSLECLFFISCGPSCSFYVNPQPLSFQSIYARKKGPPFFMVHATDEISATKTSP